jgi:NAD(P)H dehydrogenase (quinone)
MILVTGATGQVGGEALRLLAGTAPVRALVREGPWAGAPAGVEIAVGSFEDAASLERALAGVETLLLAGRDNPDQVAQHARVLEAASAAGVRHVVKLSALAAAQDSPVALMRWHAATEAQLRASSFRWTLLRPHLYMQNLLRLAGDAAGHGRLTAPMGDRGYPFVDTRDVGAAAAVVLRRPSDHDGATYALTGPRGVGYAQLAGLLAGIIGRDVTYRALAPKRFCADLVERGVPEWRADDLAGIAAAYTEQDNRVRADLPALLGRPATPIERFLADHREAFAAGVARDHG